MYACQDLLTTAFAQALDTYSAPTSAHSLRVALLASSIADKLGVDGDERTSAFHAGALHDLGKIGVDPAILDKAGPLDDSEWAEIHRHPDIGAEMLLAVSPGLASVAEGVRSHHERWDGAGYPLGLAGDGIPLLGRILAVADVFDSITHARSYRPGVFAEHEACAYLEDNAGRHFDPECVEAFAAAHNEA